MTALHPTTDPSARSWVDSANDAACDFPIQNLPYGRFRRDPQEDWRVGVAIGDRVLDLRTAGLLDHGEMHRVMQLAAPERIALRRAIFDALAAHAPDRSRTAQALLPKDDVELGLPCAIGDYTDFYAGIHHATATGRMLRPDQPLPPNYKWAPIAYHGRSSTIVASGAHFRRPWGQVKSPRFDEPALRPSARLDFELELGLYIGRPNVHGEPIPIAHAQEHLFGVTLLNDWSARDVQGWESQPLGPFLAKNFATTVSPWIVTMEALAPYRRPLRRDPGDPQPLSYLDSAQDRETGVLDIELEVWLQTAAMRQQGHAGDCIARSNYADAAYWTAAQLVTHHAINGCRLNTGDLLGTGTLSGPQPQQAGSILELTRAGKQPLQLSNGEQRGFLQDGDAVVLRGWCQREGGPRIGFGECRGEIEAALER